jgi:hypothetical protein
VAARESRDGVRATQAAIFEYVLINILLRTEQKIQAALDAAHKDLGITSLEEQRSVHKEIKRLRKRKGSGSSESPEVVTTPRTPAVSIDGSVHGESDVETPGGSASRKHDFLVREVHKAAGRFGRLFVRRNLCGNQPVS